MSRYWYRNVMARRKAKAEEVETPEETPEEENIVPFEGEEPPTEPEETPPEEEPVTEEENGDEEGQGQEAP